MRIIAIILLLSATVAHASGITYHNGTVVYSECDSSVERSGGVGKTTGTVVGVVAGAAFTGGIGGVIAGGVGGYAISEEKKVYTNHHCSVDVATDFGALTLNKSNSKRYLRGQNVLILERNGMYYLSN